MKNLITIILIASLVSCNNDQKGDEDNMSMLEYTESDSLACLTIGIGDIVEVGGFDTEFTVNSLTNRGALLVSIEHEMTILRPCTKIKILKRNIQSKPRALCDGCVVTMVNEVWVHCKQTINQNRIR